MEKPKKHYFGAIAAIFYIAIPSVILQAIIKEQHGQIIIVLATWITSAFVAHHYVSATNRNSCVMGGLSILFPAIAMLIVGTAGKDRKVYKEELYKYDSHLLLQQLRNARNDHEKGRITAEQLDVIRQNLIEFETAYHIEEDQTFQMLKRHLKEGIINQVSFDARVSEIRKCELFKFKEKYKH